MKNVGPVEVGIPDRLYFKIGEVSRIVGVDAHVLRYWETEFKVIRPLRARSRQRLYRRSDVENLIRIKTLLHDEGYTIAGARKALRGQTASSGNTGQKAGQNNFFNSLKKELQEIKKLLDE